MKEDEFKLFLSVAAGCGALGAMLTLLRIRSRGAAAVLLSASYLVFGGILLMLKAGTSQPLIVASAVLLAVLLVADFAVRSVQRSEKARKQ